MCGIVGAVAQRNIVSVLIEGLRRLEYRGYDSCGVAVLADGEPRRARSVARVADLDDQVRDTKLGGETGIAHTRWATHGAPVTDNAHPIFSRDTLAVVHNGIIENYEQLREKIRCALAVTAAPGVAHRVCAIPVWPPSFVSRTWSSRSATRATLRARRGSPSASTATPHES